MTSTRPYDMIVYGATGYTAAFTLEYLATSPTMSGYKWAVAGRNKAKLEATMAQKQKELDASGKNLNKVDFAAVPIIVASTDDKSSLVSMCQQSTVLLAMAGPYSLCGLPVIEACIEAGTHYVDITGEYQFIREAIEKYHELAEAKKVAIVTTCGFDCVPSDIGSYLVHRELSKSSAATDDAITNITGYFSIRGSAGLSGGTAHSAVNMMKTIKPADLSGVSLNPKNARAGVPTPHQVFVGWSSAVKRYCFPFIMAGGNQRIVRRSNALLGRPTTTYYECSVTPSLFQACVATAVMGIFGLFLAVPPLRYITANYILPARGDGPTAASKTTSQYKATFIGNSKAGRQFRATYGDKKNPYDSTGVMVAEAAATIVELVKSANNAQLRCGVVTPAATLGDAYVQRLMAPETGIEITVEEITKSK